MEKVVQEASIRVMADVRALLKRFGTIIYTGDPLSDLYMMEEELLELYQLGMVEAKIWMAARQVIAQEKRRLEQSH
ncbi:YqgQ family protein [Desmospora activa]|uniref:YqgQ family protein n=1 Tax=Desmospora activa TaxID=500615 RepID=UPI001FE8795C|nr:YqgQ family protein [Desmospora activa]